MMAGVGVGVGKNAEVVAGSADKISPVIVKAVAGSLSVKSAVLNWLKGIKTPPIKLGGLLEMETVPSSPPPLLGVTVISFTSDRLAESVVT